MITVTYLSPPGVTPHVFVHADSGDAVEPGGVLDQDPLALGQDRVVGGVPGNPEPFGDPGHGEVLHHESFQGPPQSAPRQFGSWLGRPAGVLTPHVPALAAPVAAIRIWLRHPV